MEIRHLQALTAISDHGTFSAAADHLNTVQSNISAHIARLERELGATLIDRADGRLTEEGEVVVARSRRILSELDALVSDVAACKDEVTGTVRVGMIGTTARWLAPRLMDLARKRHPKLRLIVSEGNTTGLEPQLASGQLDLAVLHLPVSGRDLVARILFEEDLMLVVPQGHAMANPDRPLALEDLAGLELLLPVRGTSFRDELEAVTRPLGVTLDAAAELDGLRLIASLTFEGYGPAILPATAIPSSLRSQFQGIPVEGLPRRRVGVAQRSRGLPSAPTRALNDLLKEVVAVSEDRPQGVHVNAVSSRSDQKENPR
jgi:DNA-binding transcriptional LysR family regulator